MTNDGRFLVCGSKTRCEEKISNDRWGKTKAVGWYFSRDGKTVLCPKHIPEWYNAWRENTRKKNNADSDYHGPACGCDICLGKQLEDR